MCKQKQINSDVSLEMEEHAHKPTDVDITDAEITPLRRSQRIAQLKIRTD